MFDSRQYGFCDITVIAGGKDIATLRSIKYTAKQDKELLYGKGKYPISIQGGNIAYEGEVGCLQSDLETLILNSTDGSILSLQLNIAVSYGNPLNGDVIIVDMLKGVQFTEETKEFKQGDKFAEIKLPIIFLKKVAQAGL